MSGNATNLRVKIGCAVLLALITAGVYWPVTGFDFTNYDDPDYIIYNPMVQHGITGQSVAWAFTTDHSSNWHPLTWISHTLDCDLYGLKPGGHHLTSLLFHVANTVLLFLLLEGLTGAMWRSALVAALFAWHPLHVESVAWVSERKDVLCAFFWLLTLMAYGKYVIKSKIQSPKSKIWYVAALLFFALALLSKPMAVTLPCVLLLMDYWPLERCPKPKAQSPKSETGNAGVSWGWLVAEKIPFFVLAGAECVATVWAQKAANSVVAAAALPMPYRIANALVSYVLYLWKTVWPTDLAVPYPFSHDWTFAQAAGAGALLALISAGVLWRRKTEPFLAVGWFWFIGTLVPVIGLVQVGLQFMADRYTYIPLMGVFIMVAWSIPARWAVWPRPGLVFGTVIGAVLVVLLMVTWVQLFYWQNSVTLFTHTAAVTENNILAEYNLGEALARADAEDAAVTHYLKALAIRPNRVEAQYNSQTQARFNLGLIYRSEGKWPEAAEQLEAYVHEDPNQQSAHVALGSVLLAMGRTAEGIQEDREAVRLNPNDVESLNRLAWLLATLPDAKFRDGAEAVKLAERVRDLTGGGVTRYLATLDAAYAEAGRFTDAIAAAQKTRETAQAQGQNDLAAAAETRLKLYEAGKAYHE
ncbi:MAG TPA: tetratricopeptide repeat protein [Verrucomicrobiae bacterium]|nr:tetratricopeptide repeat protein [Verrucomicrobiae bacterium]